MALRVTSSSEPSVNGLYVEARSDAEGFPVFENAAAKATVCRADGAWVLRDAGGRVRAEAGAGDAPARHAAWGKALRVREALVADASDDRAGVYEETEERWNDEPVYRNNRYLLDSEEVGGR